MTKLTNWGRALVAALLIAALPAWATQTGTAQSQAALYDSFCDQCGLPQNLSIRNLIASVILNGTNTAITGGTINGTVIGGTTPAAGTFTTASTTTAFRAADGTRAAPGVSFTSLTAAGMYLASSGLQLGYNNNSVAGFYASSDLRLTSTVALSWSSGSADATGFDTALIRDAAATLAQKNGTNAQANRLYFSTTGPIYWMQTARTAGVLLTGVGGAAQVSLAQPAVPTCTTNCGSPGNVVAGTDTAGTITMGTTPASAFVVVFSGTWPAAPSCIVQSALTSMVVGKMPIAVQSTTGQFTVTTNGTAPVGADQYSYHCFGVS